MTPVLLTGRMWGWGGKWVIVTALRQMFQSADRSDAVPTNEMDGSCENIMKHHVNRQKTSGSILAVESCKVICLGKYNPNYADKMIFFCYYLCLEKRYLNLCQLPIEDSQV